MRIAATQKEDGGAYHQYQPLTKRGNNDIGSGFNDDPLWLILGVAAYLKETGDHTFLDEQVPFDNEPGNCNLFLQRWPDAVVGLLDTHCAPGAPALDARCPVIKDFAR